MKICQKPTDKLSQSLCIHALLAAQETTEFILKGTPQAQNKDEEKKLFFDLSMVFLWFSQFAVRAQDRYKEDVKKAIWDGADEWYSLVLKKNMDMGYKRVGEKLQKLQAPDLVEWGFYVRDEKEREFYQQEQQLHYGPCERIEMKTVMPRHNIAATLFPRRCDLYNIMWAQDLRRLEVTPRASWRPEMPKLVYEHWSGKSLRWKDGQATADWKAMSFSSRLFLALMSFDKFLRGELAVAE